MSEVPLGSFLSGGIDSSAIVALMAKICPGNVKTFTVGFGEGQPGADERPYARTVAELFKTDHSECVYDNPQAQVESILPLMLEAFDEPFADSSMIPNYLVCQAARQWVEEEVGAEEAQLLFVDSPWRLIRGETVSCREGRATRTRIPGRPAARRQGWLSRLLAACCSVLVMKGG